MSFVVVVLSLSLSRATLRCLEASAQSSGKDQRLVCNKSQERSELAHGFQQVPNVSKVQPKCNSVSIVVSHFAERRFIVSRVTEQKNFYGRSWQAYMEPLSHCGSMSRIPTHLSTSDEPSLVCLVLKNLVKAVNSFWRPWAGLAVKIHW